MSSYHELLSIYNSNCNFLTTIEVLLDLNRFDLLAVLYSLPKYNPRVSSYNKLRNHVVWNIEESVMSVIDLSLIKGKHAAVINVLVGLGYELWTLLKQYELLHLFKRKKRNRLDPSRNELNTLYNTYGIKAIKEVSLYSKSGFKELISNLDNS